MAQRRMFSLKIVDTDAFLDMSQSAQLLYFHLAMRADDDGFVCNPKKISRMAGINDDDLKVLTAKKFIIPFESGVCVIKHWRIHNYIQNDRYTKTTYTKELANLTIKDNGAYKLKEECIQNVSTLETQVRLGKVRLGKERVKKNAATSAAPYSFTEIIEKMNRSEDKRMRIISAYWSFKGFSFDTVQKYTPALKRELRPAANVIGYDLERIKEVMFWLNGQIDWLDWTLETVHKYIDKDLKSIKR